MMAARNRAKGVSWAQWVYDFYSIYNLSRLQELLQDESRGADGPFAALLKKYEGREEVLRAKLLKKYPVSPKRSSDKAEQVQQQEEESSIGLCIECGTALAHTDHVSGIRADAASLVSAGLDGQLLQVDFRTA
jgi:hypothetical protein